MAETKFLNYKGKPLVRKKNEIFYGDMSEKNVVRFIINSTADDKGIELANDVSIQLIRNDSDDPIEKRVVKESKKSSLFEALDLGFTWLERALA